MRQNEKKVGKHNKKHNTSDVCFSNLGTKKCEKKLISIFAPLKISLQH